MLAIGAAVAAPVALARKDDRPASNVPVTGPAADYPVVLGSPYTIDGKTYTPADTMNYDAVGYASEDDGGAEVSAAHRILPLPSYVEVTSLQSGRTILVRVTRRGPMSGNFVVGLSAGAWKQLGLAQDGQAAVRVRRVNPPEAERALLRLGKTAPERMETPAGLLNVLRRRLGDSPDAMLSGPAQPAPKAGAPSATAASEPVPTPVAKMPAKPASTAKLAQASSPASAPKEPATPVATARPTPAPSPAPSPTPPSAPVRASVPVASPKPSPTTTAPADRWVVQVAAMSSDSRAQAVARQVGGKVARAGKFWRVQMGPFAGKAEADAALAKARAAGYADARVLHER